MFVALVVAVCPAPLTVVGPCPSHFGQLSPVPYRVVNWYKSLGWILLLSYVNRCTRRETERENTLGLLLKYPWFHPFSSVSPYFSPLHKWHLILFTKCVYIFWFLSSYITVNWISLSCGPNKTFSERHLWLWETLMNISHHFLTIGNNIHLRITHEENNH